MKPHCKVLPLILCTGLWGHYILLTIIHLLIHLFIIHYDPVVPQSNTPSFFNLVNFRGFFCML